MRFSEAIRLLPFPAWNARVRLSTEASMSTKSKDWKLVRGTWIATEPALPGVWPRKEGGHVVRGRATDARTGQQKDVWRVLTTSNKVEAHQWLRTELARIRAGEEAAAPSKTPFGTYAVSLLKRKVDCGDIQSAAGVEKWENALTHLIASRIGEMYVEKIRARDVEDWKGEVASKVNARQYAPSTFNTWLAVLKVVLEHAKRELELPHNAARDVLPLDLSRHRVYTREEPNALTVAELRDFLASMRAKYPQHFAMTYTGFATGLRPSSLRPLRRAGVTPDIDWNASLVLVRRSNARGDIVMESTKTAVDQEIRSPGRAPASAPLAHRHAAAARAPEGVRAALPVRDRRLPLAVVPRQAVRRRRQGDRPEEAHQSARDAAHVPGLGARRRSPRCRDAIDLRPRDRGDAAALLHGERDRAAAELGARASLDGLPTRFAHRRARWGGGAKWGG